MERFAINILHKQIQNICRLCGVDNPVKVPIIEEDDVICLDDDEPTLVSKIADCVGIKVCINDQMPQQICSLCIDKVNDFYEYRLMCASTNIQTRTILNLPIVQPSSTLIKTEPTEDPASEETIVAPKSKPNVKRGAKTRNRKHTDLDTQDAQGAPREKRIKTEYVCQYCNESFDKCLDLERHLVVEHSPLIRKFGCGTCAELFDTAAAYNNHNMWHKLTRTLFNCYRCKRRFAKLSTLNRHLETSACNRAGPIPPTALIPDMQCKLCSKIFKTQNLYEWHACFLRARANCPKCGKYFMKKSLLTRHYMLYCTGTNAPMEPMIVPKEELTTAGPDGASESTQTMPASVKEVKRRGRPKKVTQDESAVKHMKEETTELPFPPLLDLPGVKLENMPSDGNDVQSADSEGGAQKHLKVTFEEEANKINTLLQSGAEVNENSDIAEINSMLTSVNEAIATISNVRKLRKHKTITTATTSTTTTTTTSSTVENPTIAGIPMVQLSMANIIQEECENANKPQKMGPPMDGNDQNVINTTTAEIGIRTNDCGDTNDGEPRCNTEGEREEEGEEEFNGYEEDHFMDNTEVSDHETGESTSPVTVARNELASSSSNGATPSEVTETASPVVHLKQEPVTYYSNSETDDAEEEPPASCLTVKREPSDEDHARPGFAGAELCHNLGSINAQKVSSYQALRVKIKKEKGLLNASVIDEACDPIQLASTLKTTDSATIDSRRAKTRKEVKTPNHYKVRPMRIRPTLVEEPDIRIKQERMEPGKEYRQNGAEAVVANIKQEPLDSSVEHSNRSELAPASLNANSDGSEQHEIAFDRTIIKRELPEVTTMTERSNSDADGRENTFHDSHEMLRHAVEAIMHPKKSEHAKQRNSRSGSQSKLALSKHKSIKRINPFALLQRKRLGTSNEQKTCEHADVRSGPSTENVSLSTETHQPPSSDADEHFAKSLDGHNIAAVPIGNNGQSESEVGGARQPDDSNLAPSTIPSTTSMASAETSCENQTSVENVVAHRNTSQLRIASVSTITECATLMNEKNCASTGDSTLDTNEFLNLANNCETAKNVDQNLGDDVVSAVSSSTDSENSVIEPPACVVEREDDRNMEPGAMQNSSEGSTDYLPQSAEESINFAEKLTQEGGEYNDSTKQHVTEKETENDVRVDEDDTSLTTTSEQTQVRENENNEPSAQSTTEGTLSYSANVKEDETNLNALTCEEKQVLDGKKDEATKQFTHEGNICFNDFGKEEGTSDVSTAVEKDMEADTETSEHYTEPGKTCFREVKEDDEIATVSSSVDKQEEINETTNHSSEEREPISNDARVDDEHPKA